MNQNQLFSRRRLAALALAVPAFVIAGCGSNASAPSSGSTTGAATGSTPADAGPRATLNLGYQSNITHATVIAGLQTGIYAKDLGSNITIKTSTFTSGTPELTAILSQALDAAYIGPNPAVTAYVQSRGEAVRIISGATSGGAYLVVRPDISIAKDLKGKKLASPGLGNTQDVSLRTWLKSQGFKTDAQGGGDVSVLPEDNATTVTAFRTGQIAGAWVPEPWATILIQEGGGHVLVDERSLWPGGRYATTVLAARTAYMQKYPEVINRLLKAQIDSNTFVNTQPDQAQQAVGAALQQITGQKVNTQELAASWKNLTFSNDPIASSLGTAANEAVALGFLNLNGVDLTKIWDLGPLNTLLKAAGQPQVSSQ